MYLLFRGLEKKMNKSMYVCNCLSDTDLVSLQMNDTLTNFLRRCKSSLDGIRSGFWFYKKEDDYYTVWLKFAFKYFIEFDACIYLP